MEGERSHRSQHILKLELENCIRYRDLGIILYSLWLCPLGSRLSPLSHSSLFKKGSKCLHLTVLSACFPPVVSGRVGGVVHSYGLLLFGTPCSFWSKLVVSLLV